MEKFYCLYTDPSQGKLLACAENIDGVISESKYHTAGCWFEYDLEVTDSGSRLLWNEEMHAFDQFPEVAEERVRIPVKADDRVIAPKNHG